MNDTCIIIDDHASMATRLKTLVTDYTDLEVLLVETDPYKGIEKVCQLQPDIVFLDMEMPGINGFGVMEEIRQRKVFPAFILETVYDSYAIKTQRGPSFACLMKPVAPEELCGVIARYHRIKKSATQVNHTTTKLNQQEKEVLSLLTRGMTSKEIANRLSISNTKVQSHQQKIRTRIGAELVNASLVAGT